MIGLQARTSTRVIASPRSLAGSSRATQSGFFPPSPRARTHNASSQSLTPAHKPIRTPQHMLACVLRLGKECEQDKEQGDEDRALNRPAELKAFEPVLETLTRKERVCNIYCTVSF
jgi:hypothetical protein